MNYHIDFDIDFKRNNDKGVFIAIEGIDGAGKTTQAKLVAEELAKSSDVHLTKNPTDGLIGKFIREVLVGKVDIPPVSFQYLFSADRQVHQKVVLKDLKDGKIIITDRYFWSAIAYGIVDREDLDFDQAGNLLLVSQGILSMYHQFLLPDLTIFLEVPIDIALDRINKKNKKKEIYENEEKLNKIHKGYKWLIDKFKNEFTIIDGTKSEQEITKEIVNVFESLKNKKYGRK